ncbi:MAG: hypothetical protein RLY87_2562 [Chloroflexota bacterium]
MTHETSTKDFTEPRIPIWLGLAPVGLFLVGLGFSIASDAVIRKGKQESWFFRGTLGLILLNSGISVVGEAVRQRIHADLDIQR